MIINRHKYTIIYHSMLEAWKRMRALPPDNTDFHSHSRHGAKHLMYGLMEGIRATL